MPIGRDTKGRLTVDSAHKPPTLKTVADLTGLSLSMVSLSLRNPDAVKAETRDRVLKAAAQVGYVPNRAGVRLRTGRTNVLSLVLAAEENAIDYTRLLIQGIGSALLGSRFHLNVVPEFERTDPLAALRYILDTRSADGVILTHTQARDPRVHFLMDADFPFVCHGRTEFNRQHAFHDFHAERYLQLAVARLAGKGRKRILLAAVDNGTKNFSIIKGSFMDAVAAADLFGAVVTDPQDVGNPESARDFGHRLAQRVEPFDGIVCNNELTALALIGGLNSGGLNLCGDYDLICRQTTKLVPTLHPQIDTIGEDLTATGSQLARHLMARIEGTPIDALQTLNEPEGRWRSG